MVVDAGGFMNKLKERGGGNLSAWEVRTVPSPPICLLISFQVETKSSKGPSLLSPPALSSLPLLPTSPLSPLLFYPSSTPFL